MRTLGTVFMLVAAVAFVVSPVAYHVWSRGKWRNTPAGWHFMSYMGVMGLVMFLAIGAVLLGPLPAWVRPLVWLIIGVVAWWRLVLIFTETRHDRE